MTCIQRNVVMTLLLLRRRKHVIVDMSRLVQVLNNYFISIKERSLCEVGYEYR